jgi:hypothetical protein
MYIHEVAVSTRLLLGLEEKERSRWSLGFKEGPVINVNNTSSLQKLLN